MKCFHLLKGRPRKSDKISAELRKTANPKRSKESHLHPASTSQSTQALNAVKGAKEFPIDW